MLLFQANYKDSLKSLFKGSGYLLIGGALLGIAILQNTRLSQLQSKAVVPELDVLTQDLQILESQLKLLKESPTFGFQNLLADWTFLQFLQYFGNGPAREKTGYWLSPDFFEVVVKNDPRFLLSYLFLSTSSSLYAGTPGRTVTLMNEGLQSMAPQTPPQSYLVWRYKAIDELLFLGDGKTARNSYLKAAKWASQSPDPAAAAAVASSLQSADFLAKNPNSKPAQINAWINILLNAVDGRTQSLAIQQIEELGGTVTIENGEVRVNYRVDP